MLGLFVGYCCDLDYSLTVDIGVSVIMIIVLGINPVSKLVRCCRIELFQCNHICRYGTALMQSIVVPLTGASNEGRLWAHATLIREADISLVCPLFEFLDPCPRVGWATTVVDVS